MTTPHSSEGNNILMTRRSRRTAGLVATLACTAGLASGSVLAGLPSAARAPSAPVAQTTTQPECPNPEGGGVCLGELTANKTYSTQWFVPGITYRVGRPGWFNYEDWPGNFLLVPPGNDLAGVNAGTADYIGVYTAVQPSHIVEPDGCVIEPLPGKWNSPRAVAGYFRHNPALTTTTPKSVSVGGLDGVMITSRIKPGVPLPQCTVDGFTFDLAGVFSGIPPSYLDHSLVRNGSMRLYLLAFNDHVLAIELDDIDEAPATMAQLDRVARQLRFNVGCG